MVSLPPILRKPMSSLKVIIGALALVCFAATFVQVTMIFQSEKPFNATFLPGQEMNLTVHNASIIQPFFRYHVEHMVIPWRKLSTCLLPKNMSTLLNNIFCFLANPIYFTEKYQQLNGVQKTDRRCDGHVERYGYHNVTELVRNTTQWTHFAFIREPRERFLSGFLHICIRNAMCMGCPSDPNLLNCFMRRLYMETKRWSRQYYQGEHNRNTSYVYEMLHMTPQNWQCDFKNQMDFIEIVRYSPLDTSTVYNHIERLLDGHVERQYINEIVGQLRNQTTIHSTAHSVDRDAWLQELNGCHECMELLVKIYYFDYILFNYELPVVSKSPSKVVFN